MRPMAFILLIALGSAPVWAEQHQNGQGQQQQQQQQQGGQMGGGGGGGGEGAKYESKREELQKSFEQPGKEARKAMEEASKAVMTATDKMVAEASKSFAANTSKDQKIDEKTAEVISSIAPSNTKMMEDATNEILAASKGMSDAATNAVVQAGNIFLNAQRTVEAPLGQSMNDRLTLAAGGRPGGNGLSRAGDGNSRGPASLADGGLSNPALNHSPGANGGASLSRGFAPGLVHNPPKGF